MKTKGLISFFILTFLVGCGGGGGGKSQPSESGIVSTSSSVLSSSVLSSSPSTSSVTLSTSSSPISTSSSAALSSSSASLVTSGVVFTYPTTDSLVTSDSVVVSGVVTAENPITSVTVNGVVAEVTSSMPSTSNKLKKTSDGYTVEWAAKVDTPVGTSEVTVVASDSAGIKLGNPSGSFALKNESLPLSLYLDPVHKRFVGSDIFPFLYEFSAVDFSRKKLPEGRFYDFPVVDKLGLKLYSFSQEDNSFLIRSISLTSGLNSIDARVPIVIDSATENAAYLYGAVMDKTNDIFYYVLGYSNATSQITKSKIFKYTLSSNTNELVVELNKAAYGLSLLDTNLITVVDGSTLGVSNILKVDTAAKTFSTIYKGADSVKILPDMLGKKLYIVGRKEVSVLNLDTNVLSVLSPKNQPGFQNFSQVTHAVLDEENERLLVSDVGFRQLINVNLKSGVRSYVSKSGVGSGQKLSNPTLMELTADKKVAYVIDGALDAEDVLYRIDLSSGDRKVVRELSSIGGVGLTGLALDESNNRIFVSLGTKIVEINLADSQYRFIYSDKVGTGVVVDDVWGLEYDSKNNRLLAAAPNNGVVISIDPVTLKRSLLLEAGEQNGIKLKNIIDLQLNQDSTELYAIQQSTPTSTVELIKVVLETKKSSLLTDSCISGDDVEMMPTLFTTVLNVLGDQVLLNGENSTLVFNMDKQSCKVIYTHASSAVHVTSKTAVATSFNRIKLLDLVRSQVVVISQ